VSLRPDPTANANAAIDSSRPGQYVREELIAEVYIPKFSIADRVSRSQWHVYELIRHKVFVRRVGHTRGVSCLVKDVELGFSYGYRLALHDALQEFDMVISTPSA
jgi:hypothetical protein